MNSSIIRYILGSVLKLEGALMALPCLVSVIYKEKEGLSYLAVALGCLVFGFLLTFKKTEGYGVLFKRRMRFHST